MSLFSRGFAINRDVSLGEAPSKYTETLMNGSWTLGDAAIDISCLAYDPAMMTIKAIINVVFAFDKAKSIIRVIVYLLRLFDYLQQILALEQLFQDFLEYRLSKDLIQNLQEL
jgi:hypothetical protein